MLFLSLPNLPKVIPYADLRERMEWRTNRDFDRTIQDHRVDLFTRWRVGVRIPLTKGWRAQAEFQYAHDLTWTKARNFSTENRDLSLGYLEGQEKGWTLDVGRQKISVGQQRLVGAVEWANLARSFDAVRLRSKAWDLFGGKIGVASPYPARARLAGVSRTDPHAGNSVYLFKHDSGVDVHTLDHALQRTVGTLTFDGEGALQFGQESGRRQAAWAIHMGVTAKSGNRRSVFITADAASGGAGLGTSRTFDNLYPSNHGRFGIADMAGWKNIRHLSMGADFAVSKQWTLRGSWHNLALWDARDAWYAASGVPNKHGALTFQDPTGTHGRDLGNEFDIEANGAIQGVTVSFGLGVFEPGGFVRRLTGRNDVQVFGALQVSARF